MAFVLEAGNPPYRYIYLCEAYRDLDGKPRNRRIRIGKVNAEHGVKIYTKEFLRSRVLNSIEIPEDLRKNAENEMRRIMRQHPHLIGETDGFEGVRRGVAKRKALTPLFSVRDIREATTRSCGLFHLFNGFSESIELLPSLSRDFPEHANGLFTLSVFLTAADKPLSLCRDWSEENRMPAPGLSLEKIAALLAEVTPKRIENYLASPLWREISEDDSHLAYVFPGERPGTRDVLLVGENSGIPLVFRTGLDPPAVRERGFVPPWGEDSPQDDAIVATVESLSAKDLTPRSLLARREGGPFAAELSPAPRFAEKALEDLFRENPSARVPRKKEFLPGEHLFSRRVRTETGEKFFIHAERIPDKKTRGDLAAEIPGPAYPLAIGAAPEKFEIRFIAANVRGDFPRARDLIERRLFLENALVKTRERFREFRAEVAAPRAREAEDFVTHLTLLFSAHLFGSFRGSWVLRDLEESFILKKMEDLEEVDIRGVKFIKPASPFQKEVFKAFGLNESEILAILNKVEIANKPL
ncbi:MAG: hypothetical protein LBF41_10365 [Deltaproteobacteria bacterium]|jgi:hypothetical protein|nr:hypothetical protein [Deltaproteobacteria bacterium]